MSHSLFGLGTKALPSANENRTDAIRIEDHLVEANAVPACSISRDEVSGCGFESSASYANSPRLSAWGGRIRTSASQNQIREDSPLEAAGFETLHFRIGVRQDSQLGAGAFNGRVWGEGQQRSQNPRRSSRRRSSCLFPDAGDAGGCGGKPLPPFVAGRFQPLMT